MCRTLTDTGMPWISDAVTRRTRCLGSACHGVTEDAIRLALVIVRSPFQCSCATALGLCALRRPIFKRGECRGPKGQALCDLRVKSRSVQTRSGAQISADETPRRRTRLHASDQLDSAGLLAELRGTVVRLCSQEGANTGSEFRQEPGCLRLANLVNKGRVFSA